MYKVNGKEIRRMIIRITEVNEVESAWKYEEIKDLILYVDSSTHIYGTLSAYDNPWFYLNAEVLQPSDFISSKMLAIFGCRFEILWYQLKKEY